MTPDGRDVTPLCQLSDNSTPNNNIIIININNNINNSNITMNNNIINCTQQLMQV